MELNKAYRLGLIAEKLVFGALSSLFPKWKGHDLWHTSWKPYNTGRGLDSRVITESGLVMGFEVKNWRQLGRPYGYDVTVNQILDRFRFFKHAVREFGMLGCCILIISFEGLLTKRAKKLLRSHSINILSVDKLLGRKDFKRSIFYSLKRKILSLVESGARFGLYQSELHKKYATATNLSKTLKNNTITKSHSKPHNTPAIRILNLIKLGSGEYG